jgi:hypothetical protein
MKKLKYIKIYPLFSVLLAFTACIDENITHVSEDMDITSGFSIPGGPLTYSINNYLESLDTIVTTADDSLFYNDTLYPNYLDYLIRIDNEDFDFTRLSDNLDHIESIMFRLIVTNGYPTKAITQIYFTDDINLIIDSLFADGPYVLPSAPVNNEGKVTSPYEEIVDIYMSSDFIDHMPDIRNMLIHSVIYTKRDDIRHVKFYSDYVFKINIAARVLIRYNTNEL